jgi:hypothetical protein
VKCSAPKPLMVALRPSHRFTSRPSVALAELTSRSARRRERELFPAGPPLSARSWRPRASRPPSVELEETDLNATRWVEQGNVDWI